MQFHVLSISWRDPSVSANRCSNKSNTFEVLGKLGKPVGYGAVLCFTPAVLPLAKDVDAVPVWAV